MIVPEVVLAPNVATLFVAVFTSIAPPAIIPSVLAMILLVPACVMLVPVVRYTVPVPAFTSLVRFNVLVAVLISTFALLVDTALPAGALVDALNVDINRSGQVQKRNGKRRLVFAPTKYLDQEQLDTLRIDFAQLPFEIYKLAR